jgi:hypothetical protein
MNHEIVGDLPDTVFLTDLLTISFIDLLVDFSKDSGPLHDP